MSVSISGRAVTSGLVGVEVINLRDFGTGNYRQLDDYAFGSGGMLFAAPQLKKALEAASRSAKKPFVVFPSPQGELLSQEIVETLALQEHVIILCGHYEGIDERFIERYVDLEVRVGDCVLTGGEIPAMIVVDAMSRLVPGVVGRGEAVIEDSFYRGMLDHPHYTRPASWEGMEVPEVLLSGNAKEISNWRRSKAVERTLARRPDLISKAAIRDYVPCGVYLAVILSNGNDEGVKSIPAIVSLCEVYDLGRPFVVARTSELRETVRKFSSAPKILGSINKVLQRIDEKVLVIKVMLGPRVNSIHVLEIKRMCLEHEGPVLFLFSDNESALESVDGLSTYLYDTGQYEQNRLPLDIKTAIALDRLLGKR